MAVNRMGPPCPECGCLVTDVTRTNSSSEGHFLRRRDCPSCGARFHTVQHAEIVAPEGAVTWQSRRISIHWRALRSQLIQLIA